MSVEPTQPEQSIEQPEPTIRPERDGDAQYDAAVEDRIIANGERARIEASPVAGEVASLTKLLASARGILDSKIAADGVRDFESAVDYRVTWGNNVYSYSAIREERFRHEVRITAKLRGNPHISETIYMDIRDPGFLHSLDHKAACMAASLREQQDVADFKRERSAKAQQRQNDMAEAFPVNAETDA